MDENSTPDSQVRVLLTTRDQNLTLDESGPILVPTSFRRYALSTLVNSLLKKDQTVPLEFLVNGSYLRTTLEEFLSSSGISTETTLPLEYVRARIPPQYVASFEHDDWVSSVDVLSEPASKVEQLSQAQRPSEARILSSSYDGHIRVWNSSSQIVATSPDLRPSGGLLAAIKDAKFVSPTKIASSGSDRVVRIWKYSEEKEGFSGTISPEIELWGHQASVDSLSVHTSSNRLLSASADHRVALWSTRKADAPPSAEDSQPRTGPKDGKRRKLNSAKSVTRGPLAMMHQHTQPVSGATFDVHDATVAYSSSWDQSVRTWDLVTGSLVDTRTTANALFCIEQMPELNLIAAGSAGRDIKLIDPRASATTVTAMTLKGHKNNVVSLARDPRNEYTVVSGSHDGTCRVWDVRSTQQGKDGVTGQSIYTLTRQSLKGGPIPAVGTGVKVFGVCWDAEVGIVSGGEDKMVQINHSDDP